MMQNYAVRMDAHEQRVVAAYHTLVGSTLHGLSNANLETLLCQRRVLSLEYFERFYNTAICALANDEAKSIARGIVADEYPLKRSNHREDMVHDLQQVGISRERILRTAPTTETQGAIDAMLDLVRYDGSMRYDLRTLTALRVGGETLAGEEMGLLCTELGKRYGLTARESRFFWPHVTHDSKRVPLGAPGISHADQFGVFLAKLVITPEDFAVVKKMMDRAYGARSVFYDQFKRSA